LKTVRPLLFFLIFTLLSGSGTGKAEGLSPAWLYEVARRLVNIPYRWGGNGYGGVDCSGLVVYVYRHLGVQLPRTSREQFNAVQRVNAVLPGDLLFFSESGRYVDHVGIYLYQDPKTKDLLMLHASGKRGRVVVEPLRNYQKIFVGAGRVRTRTAF